MTQKWTRVSRRMLFTWCLLGGLICLFAPPSLTSKLQLAYTYAFSWPLQAGHSLSLASGTLSPLREAGAADVLVLYGGSVKADNAKALFGMPDIDGGLIGGALAGSLFHKGLSISKEQQARLNSELDAGKAAVGLMVEAEEADLVKAKLIEPGYGYVQKPLRVTGDGNAYWDLVAVTPQGDQATVNSLRQVIAAQQLLPLHIFANNGKKIEIYRRQGVPE